MYPEDVRGEGPRRQVEHQFRISVGGVKGRFLGDGWLHEEGGGQERASGFIALGEIAGTLDGELTNYLPTITSHLRDAIAPRRGRPSLEALACVGNIAKAMGPTMEPHVRGLLDSMFSSRLSLTLVEAFEQITERFSLILRRTFMN
ncbi:hypothetical protein CQW23_31725 [Capsicum baccatum]|uniref:Serine/threonine-protein kinase TOR n=1 Tax=Capsicum baccatum TaxID=33114 RepID=A0A2G2V6U6_CAPBA|nr:hypothetical protein CQW23_31725 [Capsicum baccatum]